MDIMKIKSDFMTGLVDMIVSKALAKKGYHIHTDLYEFSIKRSDDNQSENDENYQIHIEGDIYLDDATIKKLLRENGIL